MLKIVLQDSIFIVILLATASVIITFLYKAVRAGYRKAMIEHMRNMSEAPNFIDTTEERELESIPQNTEGQKPKYEMQTVHMLAPNTAQYGHQYANYVPSANGIPLSAYPNIDMKNPWSVSQIQAAELPEKEGCRKSVTGLFYECGVTPSNFCG